MFLKKWILKIIINWIKNKIKGGKRVENIRKWLEGKKSYAVLVCAIITGVLQSQGIVVPEGVWLILASIFGITYKAGMNRSEQATKDLLDEIKKAKENK